MIQPFLAPIFTLLLLTGCGSSTGPNPDGTPRLEGPYFGETPPGSTPVRFAPQIITLELHSSPVFSPTGDEVFWSEMEGGGLQFMEVLEGEWSDPAPAPFALPYSGEPVYGPEGNTLYFLAGQRLAGGEWDEDVWKVTKVGGAWSEPESLGSPVNDHPMHWGVSLADNGNLYFGHSGGDGDLYVAIFRDGVYEDPVPLPSTVNSTDGETTPCVAPDESYLVFSRVVDHGQGPLDLYVSFRGEDGGWGEALPLSPLNTSEREISPRLSPDGQYLFFLRTVRGELRPFWVSTSVITSLQPE